eukprot:1157825-Pelagomonas_calceolata.AAC.1
MGPQMIQEHVSAMLASSTFADARLMAVSQRGLTPFTRMCMYSIHLDSRFERINYKSIAQSQPQLELFDGRVAARPDPIHAHGMPCVPATKGGALCTQVHRLLISAILDPVRQPCEPSTEVDALSDMDLHSQPQKSALQTYISESFTAGPGVH